VLYQKKVGVCRGTTNDKVLMITGIFESAYGKSFWLRIGEKEYEVEKEKRDCTSSEELGLFNYA
jgi:hypothetical protein